MLRSVQHDKTENVIPSAARNPVLYVDASLRLAGQVWEYSFSKERGVSATPKQGALTKTARVWKSC